MIRDPSAPYESKRVGTILKVKPTLDTEGIVIGLIEGKGKHMGHLGALKLQLPSGVTVKVGSGFTDEQRKQYFTSEMLGKPVTIKYMTLTRSGTPRQPVFHRVRHNAGI